MPSLMDHNHLLTCELEAEGCPRCSRVLDATTSEGAFEAELGRRGETLPPKS